MAEQWPQIIKEAYVAWNMMRTLGFKADDLFMECDKTHVAIALHLDRDLTNHGKSFVILLGKLEMPQDLLYQLWQKFTADLQSGIVTDAELAKFNKEAKIRKMAVHLVTSLSAKGLYPVERTGS